MKTAVEKEARRPQEAVETISILYDGWKHFERPDFAVYKGASGGGFEKIRPKKANEEKNRGLGAKPAQRRCTTASPPSCTTDSSLITEQSKFAIFKNMQEMKNVLEYTRRKCHLWSLAAIIPTRFAFFRKKVCR